MPTDSPKPPRSPGSPHPPTPPKAWRTAGPRPMLKLHRDETDSVGLDVATYKFPTPRSQENGRSDATDARHRLVAAQVKRSPLQDAFDGSACGVLHGGDDPDCIGRIVSSGQLVREIEHTLDRMQNRLNDFREEMDRAFQFPLNRGDDDLPPAA